MRSDTSFAAWSVLPCRLSLKIYNRVLCLYCTTLFIDFIQSFSAQFRFWWTVFLASIVRPSVGLFYIFHLMLCHSFLCPSFMRNYFMCVSFKCHSFLCHSFLYHSFMCHSLLCHSFLYHSFLCHYFMCHSFISPNIVIG